MLRETFTLDEQNAITRAKDIETTIYALWAEQDQLLDPLSKKAIAAGHKAVQELISLLPPCFHRMELQTWLNLKDPDLFKPNT